MLLFGIYPLVLVGINVHMHVHNFLKQKLDKNVYTLITFSRCAYFRICTDAKFIKLDSKQSLSSPPRLLASGFTPVTGINFSELFKHFPTYVGIYSCHSRRLAQEHVSMLRDCTSFILNVMLLCVLCSSICKSLLVIQVDPSSYNSFSNDDFMSPNFYCK